MQRLLRQSTAVDVLIGPFIDDTDFKTPETALTITNTDTQLSKNGQALANRSDTTSCAHDASGYYNCELDATDTNTLGQLRITVNESGSLPMWEDFFVLQAAAYDRMVSSTDAPTLAKQNTIITDIATVDGNVDSILTDTGTTLPAQITALNDFNPASDDVAVVTLVGTTTANTDMRGTDSAATEAKQDIIDTNVDSILVDTAEIGVAGAGLTDIIGAEGDTLESLSGQIDSIGTASGGALNFAAIDDNVGGAIKGVTFVGVESSGTFASTEAEDASYHQITHSGNAFDVVYEYSIGGARTAAEILWRGSLVSNNDVMSIQVYNGTTWDTIQTVNGHSNSAPTVSTDNTTIRIPLLSKHTGTGADLGKVFLRFVTSGQTSPVLYTDQFLVSAVNIGQTVGYANGQIWINTNKSNTSTEPFVDGVADNPVSTLAAALTLSADNSVNLVDFHVINGSSVTFAASMANKSMFGDHYSVALGGQACGGLYLQGATVSGAGTSSGEEMHFEGCDFETVTVEQAHWDKCGFSGTVTMNTADNYDLHGCYSKGAAVPVFNKTAGQAIIFETHFYSGDITCGGIESGDSYELRGDFGTIVLNGADGTVHVHGTYQTIIDNRTGSPVLDFTGAIKNGDSAAIKAITDNNTGGDLDVNVVKIDGSLDAPGDLKRWLFTKFSGTTGADGAANGTTIIDDDLFFGDNNIVGHRLIITDPEHAQEGEARIITGYIDSTSTVTVSPAFSGQILSGVFFTIEPANSNVQMWNQNAVTGDGDWAELQTDVDTLLTDLATVDSNVDAIKVSTDNLPSDPASETNVNANETKIDAIIATLGAAGAGLTDLGSMSTGMKAEINAEIVDVLTVDTIPELTAGAPATTPTFRDAVMLLYMSLRNKNISNASTNLNEIHNNADTVITKSTISDDGSIFTKTKFIAP